MNKMMAVVMMVISIAISFVVFPIITDATRGLLTDDVTQTVASATTANGTYVATVQDEIYDEDVDSVISVTTDVQADNPVVSAVSGKTITITGLNTSAADRTITIKYQKPALTEFTGMAQIVKIIPLLVLVAIFGGLFGGTYAVMRNR